MARGCRRTGRLLIGLVLAFTGPPGTGYAVILIVLGLLDSAAILVLSLIKQP